MSYFRSFPFVAYNFGDVKEVNAFTEISRYATIVEELRDDAAFYREYTILDGDRPDNLSQKLYGTPDYYWTFFLLNDNLKEQGWPLTNTEIVEQAKTDYPNTTLSTTDDLTGIFKVGQQVQGLSTGATGTIIKRRLNFGQLIVKGAQGFIDGEIITTTVDGDLFSTQLIRASEEYNAIHHWEDEDGNYVDVSPYVNTSAIYTAVTFLDRYQRSNDELKNIKILKNDVINDVVVAFSEAISS